MTIENVRELLGEKYDSLPDESIQSLIEFINCVCKFVIATESWSSEPISNPE